MPRRVTSAQFIGRADALVLLDDLLESTRLGQGDVLLIAGEAGVGKTRLVAELITRARHRGLLPLTGWCVEHGDQVTPLAPVADIVRELLARTPAAELDDVIGPAGADLAALLPDLGPTGELSRSPASVGRLFEGVLGVLRRLSARQPVVTVVEDLHWADESTRQLLAFLAPRLMDHPVLLVATYRSDELHRRHPLRPFLVSVERSVRPERIDLVPFTPTELAELVAAVTQTAADRQFTAALHARSGGNGFFAEELLAKGRRASFPPLLRDAVMARTTELDPTALSVLRTAAAGGPVINTAVLRSACELNPPTLDSAIEALVDGGLWVRDGQILRFRHELTREVVEAEFTAGDRAAVHGSLAAAITDIEPSRTGDIARHWAISGDQPRALETAAAAARAAVAMGAHAEALLQFERILEWWDRVPDAAMRARFSHGEVLLEAADTAGRARWFSRALGLGRQAVTELSGGDPVAQGLACLRLVDWAWFAEQGDDAQQLIDRANAVIPADPPTPALALALAWRALLLAEDGSERAPRLAAEAEELARSCGAERAEAHAALTLATFRCASGDPAGLAELRACIGPARSLRCALEAGRAYHSLAAYSYQFGRYTDVLDLEAEALEYCAAAGIYRVYGIMIELAVIRSLARLGRWSAAETRVTRVCAEFGDQPVEHFTLAGSWGLIAIRQGRLDGVGDMIADATARMHDHTSALGPTATAAVELAAAQGRVTDVPPIVDEALDRILPRYARDAADLVASAVGVLADVASTPKQTTGPRSPADLERRAEAWCVRVERSCAPTMLDCIPDLAPRLELARTELSRLSGDSSPHRWAELVGAWDRIGATYDGCYARSRLAEALLVGPDKRSVDARTEARSLLSDARHSATRMGAAPLVAGIDALARRAHLTLDLEPPGDRPTSTVNHAGAHAFGLTDREDEVLRLVVDGYSNGQIRSGTVHQSEDGQRSRVQHPSQTGCLEPSSSRRRRDVPSCLTVMPTWTSHSCAAPRADDDRRHDPAEPRMGGWSLRHLGDNGCWPSSLLRSRPSIRHNGHESSGNPSPSSVTAGDRTGLTGDIRTALSEATALLGRELGGQRWRQVCCWPSARRARVRGAGLDGRRGLVRRRRGKLRRRRSCIGAAAGALGPCRTAEPGAGRQGREGRRAEGAGGDRRTVGHQAGQLPGRSVRHG